MNEKSYNGWKNYETWLVKLWLDNDQYTSEQQTELAHQARTGYHLAEMVKQFVEEDYLPELPNGLASDLINAAMCEVNWQEIAEYILDGLPEEESPEEESEESEEDAE